MLKHVRDRGFTQKQIAEHVGMDPKTVRRWEKGETRCPTMLEASLRDMLLQAAPLGGGTEKQDGFSFIDLFAGIGGIRMGFESH
ncbi:helix-turn-helix domain-containing protein, partial [Paraburkholderia sp. SIMBA_009]